MESGHGSGKERMEVNGGGNRLGSPDSPPTLPFGGGISDNSIQQLDLHNPVTKTLFLNRRCHLSPPGLQTRHSSILQLRAAVETSSSGSKAAANLQHVAATHRLLIRFEQNGLAEFNLYQTHPNDRKISSYV